MASNVYYLFFYFEILLTYINLYVNIYFKVDKVNNTIILVYISMEHYSDFKRKRGIMG